MEVGIEGAWQRKIVVAGSLFATLLVIFQAGKVWVADRRIHSMDPNEIARGAEMVPEDGDAWQRLGHARQWDLVRPNVSAAIEDYRKALQQDSLSADYWMDLAIGYEDLGNHDRARDAFEHAKRVYPGSAEVAFNYGNFLLRHGDSSNGYAEIERAISIDPSLVSLVVSRGWGSGVDAEQLLDHVLPPDANAYLQALDFFSSIQRGDAALVVWQRLVALGKPISISRTFPFFDELIAEDRSDVVRQIWPQALAGAGLPSKPPANDSVIWNGDFGNDFINGGLDWRWDPIPDVTIGFDSEPQPGSGRAVRLDFEGGTNLDLHAPVEYVPVEPNQTYHFRADMRTQGVTTESGVHFAIMDPNHPGQLNANTPDLTGSHAWAAVEIDMKTGGDTHFLLIRLLRTPSRLFENRLAGTAWIANVSLTPAKTVLPTKTQ
jgi:tetratricopeptide (TPR) repeat protein